ncbi:MAG: chemotaxis protein CheR [Bacteroidetes bacterium RIFOXYA12_FULL_35_11]|nr:MAG: chemotaxis protein CheR [Bacteroidetes bacterium GWF2_35_48]OFY73834.1 MAG: chemotaxis protein CheR [Bacteroidetes bacterium RIFOXYA12_FULL_35_11]OFY93106.1 MAG: chemotaxis protein CheR [Bacteroidetes bacterium RIFOXYB2_FULL_35_7]OFZ03188.1 MAG: chemotaxis protein CheR [Bacteroidetes bacterium RIFOXYC12_FULL_35_7]HBX49885.1 chemotaxis protein CheR [Bacteroidales bacterium]
MAFTFFFRDSQTLDMLATFLVQYSSGRMHIKVWNPGCASGQEPYTFAMMLSEKMGHFAFRNLIFHNTDIDISNLFQEIIEKGIYKYEELQRIPIDLFEKYFKHVTGDLYQIDEKLRKKMIYYKHDLTTLKPIDSNYSLVLCKNVLLHLQYEQRVEVIQMFYNSLSDGGLLAMEQTQKMPEEVSHLFHPIASNAQIYLKL